MTDEQTNAQKHECHHEWRLCGRWGVIPGMSRCKLCGEMARTEHFPHLAAKENAARQQDQLCKGL